MSKQRHSQKLSYNRSTLDPTELKKFSALAEKWWDMEGAFKHLHLMNRIRISYIQFILRQEGLIEYSSLENLKILDVGCGGGILSLPLSKLGGLVSGIDASPENIEIAKQKAKNSDLDIDFDCSSVEDFAAVFKNRDSNLYDIVCALEIVEHVSDLDLFIESLTSLTKVNGIIFVSTINRTIESYIKAILIAEKALKIVPDDTHDWNKFVKPSELAKKFRDNGCKILGIKGMKLKLLQNEWVLDSNVNTNYIISFKKEL